MYSYLGDLTVLEFLELTVSVFIGSAIAMSAIDGVIDMVPNYVRGISGYRGDDCDSDCESDCDSDDDEEAYRKKHKRDKKDKKAKKDKKPNEPTEPKPCVIKATKMTLP